MSCMWASSAATCRSTAAQIVRVATSTAAISSHEIWPIRRWHLSWPVLTDDTASTRTIDRSSATVAMFAAGRDLVRMCGAELVLTYDWLSRNLPAETARTSMSFTIFEGTSEIQPLIIGRAVTGLDIR